MNKATATTKPPPPNPRALRVLAQGPGSRRVSLECVEVDFDEIVVGNWLHIEHMGDMRGIKNFWARIGGATFSFNVSKSGDVDVLLVEIERGPQRTTLEGFEAAPKRAGKGKARR